MAGGVEQSLTADELQREEKKQESGEFDHPHQMFTSLSNRIKSGWSELGLIGLFNLNNDRGYHLGGVISL